MKKIIFPLIGILSQGCTSNQPPLDKEVFFHTLPLVSSSTNTPTYNKPINKETWSYVGTSTDSVIYLNKKTLTLDKEKGVVSYDILYDSRSLKDGISTGHRGPNPPFIIYSGVAHCDYGFTELNSKKSMDDNMKTFEWLYPKSSDTLVKHTRLSIDDSICVTLNLFLR